MASILNVDKIRATGSTNDGLTVDSSGRVNLPKVPAFMADMRGQGTVNSTGVLPFVNVRLDNGNNYNTTDKKFTAPIDGIYIFNYGCLVRNAIAGFQLLVNGSATSSDRTGYADAIPSGGITGLEIMVSGSQILDLTANDYVQVNLQYFAGQDIYANDISYFNGHLVG